MDLFRRTPPLAVKGDQFKGRRSGKIYTVVHWTHNSFANHDVFTLEAEDGERKTVASFRLYHKFEKITPPVEKRVMITLGAHK